VDLGIGYLPKGQGTDGRIEGTGEANLLLSGTSVEEEGAGGLKKKRKIGERTG